MPRNRLLAALGGFACSSMPSCVLAAAPWQTRDAPWKEHAFYVVALAVALLLAGIAIVSAMVREMSRNEPLAEKPVVHEPPSGLPAPLAGALRAGDANMSHAAAALVHLAARGCLRFETERGGRWGRTHHFARLRPGHVSLRPWESAVLAAAFQGAGPQALLPVTKIWTNVRRRLAGFRDEVRRELQAMGDLDPARAEGRRRLLRLAGLFALLAIAAAVAVVFARSSVGRFGAAIPVALLLDAVVALATGATLPRLSDRGWWRAARWRAFAQHLHELAKSEPAAVESHRYTDWLPYAVALGLGREWLEAGKRWEMPPPPWVHDKAAGGVAFTDLSEILLLAATEAQHGSHAAVHAA